MRAAERPTVAILASGSGTTAEYVIHATQSGVLQAEVAMVIGNNPGAAVFERVRRLNRQYGLQIGATVINGRTHPGGAVAEGAQTDEEAKAIAEMTKGVALVALLGYMKKVRGPLLERPVVNTHPGPLPVTEGCIGIGAQDRVLALGLTASAQTLHWVDAEYDRGAIIAAHEVPVLPGDTPDSLFDAVQATEKSWLPVDLNSLLT